MLRRTLLMLGLLLASLLAISPAYADEDDDKWNERVTIRGEIWLDENADGRRQPSEPLVPNVRASTSVNGYYGPHTKIDKPGHFTLEVRPYHKTTGGGPHTPGAIVWVRFYHLKQGDEPVWDSVSGKDHTHVGCGSLSVEPGEVERTMNVGLLKIGNFPIAEGRFFNEGSWCGKGYSVTNADAIPFWDTLQRLGLENVGYPLSQRFRWKGFVIQIFQRAIMQWQPGKGVFLVNILDELTGTGDDRVLQRIGEGALRVYPSWNMHNEDDILHLGWAAPGRIDPSIFDAGKSWDEIVGDRLALLEDNPAIKEKYYAAPDPLLLYGLPTSRIEDYGHFLAIRTQRTVLYQWKRNVPWPRSIVAVEKWKKDTPWAKAGEATIANGGQIFRWFLITRGSYTEALVARHPSAIKARSTPPWWKG